MPNRIRTLAPTLFLVLLTASVHAQELPPQASQRARNHPLPSLDNAAQRARGRGIPFTGMVSEVPNKAFKGDTRTQTGTAAPTGVLQSAVQTSSPVSPLHSFNGADNYDNAELLGYMMAPPDTDGDVGPNHFVQMINVVTTVFDKNGNELGGGSFPSNAFWEGMGGVCEDYNRGDPIVLYDESADRWLVSQFAFPSISATPYYQCIAVSQTGDPLGAYNRYGFDFSEYGFNDYPKHGITSDAVTLMANIFVPPTLGFGGAFLGAIDKWAMYNGQEASMVGAMVSGWGFAAGDLDDPTGTAGFVPALFATAMMRTGYLDIWEVDPDFAAGTASVSRIAGVPIAPFDDDLCTASREACIQQPSPGYDLEALSGRLMHRLAIRDFGSHLSMVAAHTVDAGGGRAGIRWYEVRNSGGGWSLYQQSTFAPDDGLHRWMPSIAMNQAGDIGLGYLVASADHFVSIGVTGQTAASSGSGLLDASEILCVEGGGSQTNTKRAGDYSATKVDPISDSFWHTNEYVPETGSFRWATRVCEFSVTGDGAPPPPPEPPVASFTGSPVSGEAPLTVAFSDASTGAPTAWSWDFGDGATSNERHPSHVFDVGTYTVTLTVTNANGSDQQTRVDYVSVAAPAPPPPPEPPVASFTGSPVSGEAPLTVSFSDASTGVPTAWNWDFGDGGTSTAQHPSHAFEAGTYTVTLTVTNANGSDQQTRVNYVTVAEPAPPPTPESYVASIVTGTLSGDKGRKHATATVTLRDSQGNPVSSAFVTGRFAGDFVESGGGTTASDGTIVFTTSSSKKLKGEGAFDFCVADIQHPSLTYNPNLNPVASYACSNAIVIDDNADVHVDAIEVGTVNRGKGAKAGAAKVTVRDNQGNVVSGYTVTGSFSGSFSDGPLEAVTDGAGVARFETISDASGGVSVAFCVGAVSGSLNYDPNDNADPNFDCSVNKGISFGVAQTQPAGFTLDQNYPNPFNPTTIVPFMVTQSVHVRLVVIDLLGREVAVLVDGMVSAGRHRAAFDASHLPAGIYLYVLDAAGERETRRMTLLK